MNHLTKILLLIKVLTLLLVVNCSKQLGPDPWNLKKVPISNEKTDVPPDLKLTATKEKREEQNHGYGDWFFKRMIAVMLKGGQYKQNDEGDYDINLKLKVSEDDWVALNEYINFNDVLTEDIFRKALGRIENSILKPNVVKQVALAWTDYISVQLTYYKMEITGTFIFLLVIFITKNNSNLISRRAITIIIFIVLFIYEAVISYKEAEKNDFDQFMAAINKCKWHFWTSSCDMPHPDPINFLKHMHPLKIGVRLFTILLSEPLVGLSSTITEISNKITDGLYFPFDKILSGFLIMSLNVIVLMIVVMVVFNFLLNIPINFSLLAGMFSVGISQRNKTSNHFNNNENQRAAIHNDSNDRLSGPNLDRLLTYIINQNQATHQNRNNSPAVTNTRILPPIKRSHSAGRLSDLKPLDTTQVVSGKRKLENGSGDKQ